jgi:hypothetical protein
MCCPDEGHRDCHRAPRWCSLLLPYPLGRSRCSGSVDLSVVLDAYLKSDPSCRCLRLVSGGGFKDLLWNPLRQPTHLRDS